MPDGFVNRCIECAKKNSMFHYNKNMTDEDFVKSERERCKKDYVRKRKNLVSFFQRYPEKYKAAYKANYVKKKLKIISKNQFHHWSYNESHFADVIEIEKKNHYELHKKIKYDYLSKMYYTLCGRLLDTKEKHIEFIILQNIQIININPFNHENSYF